MLDKVPLWEITKVARGDRELEEMFQELDVDQDGHITREEMEVRRRTRIGSVLLRPWCIQFMSVTAVCPIKLSPMKRSDRSSNMQQNLPASHAIKRQCDGRHSRPS